MNYLAHAFLSFGEEKILVGNLVGDFVKGRKRFENYPKNIQNGILLHRHIDAFTDRHPVLKESVARLKPTQNRYASVVVDILYDYFLANNWSKYSDEPLEVFANKTYRQLEQNFHLMPEKVSWIFGRMIADNWLIGYEFEERMEFTFEKVSNRVKNDHNMLTAIDDLRKYKAVLNDDFQRFFPDLLESTKVEFKKIVLDV
jgi:acyl carrier protein phosphodiesterase|tara:strand:+ start:1291 stop:1890 length:600 start_codon:yes stop_codon:yes gene_type:complete